MKINPYQSYTAVVNEKEITTAAKVIKEQPQKVEEKQAEIVLDEYEILTQLNDHYDLVQKKMVFFGGTVLQTVASDPNKVDLLKKAMDLLEQKHENSKNHAIASGEELQHFSSEISEVSETDSFAMKVETWTKRTNTTENSGGFTGFSLKNTYTKAKKSSPPPKTMDEEKIEAKEQYQIDQKSTGTMVYQVELVENTASSKHGYTV